MATKNTHLEDVLQFLVSNNIKDKSQIRGHVISALVNDGYSNQDINRMYNSKDFWNGIDKSISDLQNNQPGNDIPSINDDDIPWQFDTIKKDLLRKSRQDPHVFPGQYQTPDYGMDIDFGSEPDLHRVDGEVTKLNPGYDNGTLPTETLPFPKMPINKPITKRAPVRVKKKNPAPQNGSIRLPDLVVTANRWNSEIEYGYGKRFIKGKVGDWPTISVEEKSKFDPTDLRIPNVGYINGMPVRREGETNTGMDLRGRVLKDNYMMENMKGLRRDIYNKNILIYTLPNNEEVSLFPNGTYMYRRRTDNRIPSVGKWNLVKRNGKLDISMTRDAGYSQKYFNMKPYYK